MKAEPVSVVVLARDDADGLRETLDAALLQLRDGDELVVVHGGPRPGTRDLLEGYATEHPHRVRALALPVDPGLPELRAEGVRMAHHDVVAFLRGDAAPEPEWLDQLRAAIANADVAYGRQRHAPARRNAPTVSRGLRYHRFEREGRELPETYASPNAAYRRFALDTLAGSLDEADDAALARIARLSGLRITYARHAVIRHRESSTWLDEWRGRVRDGARQAQRRALLGTPTLHLAWALTVGLLGVATVALSSAWLLALTLVAFFLPTLRRLASPAARRYPPLDLVAGAAVSPLFDLAFVGGYLTRRVRRG